MVNHAKMTTKLYKTIDKTDSFMGVPPFFFNIKNILICIWLAAMLIFYKMATKYSWRRHKDLFIYKEYMRLIEEVIKDDD